MSSPDDTVTSWREQAAAHQRLHQIAELVSEYAELPDRTGNADLIALVFQVTLVLGDDHSEPIEPQHATHIAESRTTSPRGRTLVDGTGG